MKRIVVATRNSGKLAEIERRISDLGWVISSLADFDDDLEIVEDADTFEGNAVKKARAAFDAFGCPSLSDDSGLEVDALDGRPGVYSARYGGESLDDKGRNLHLLQELAHVPSPLRTARFRAVIAFCPDRDETTLFHGVLEGTIALSPAGAHGFGYDPVFVPRGYEQTLAALGPQIKGRISHRAKALNDFVRHLSAEGTHPPPHEHTKKT